MKSIKKLFRYYNKSNKLKITFLLIITLVLKLLSLLIPVITEKIINVITYSHNLEVLIRYIIVFIAIIITFIICLCTRYYIQGRLENKVKLDIKKNMVNKMNRIKSNILNKNSSGYYIKRINDDLNNVESLYINDFLTLGTNIIYGAGILYLMIKSNIVLSLLLLVILPIFYLGTKIFVPKIANVSKKIIEEEEKLNTITEDNYAGNIDIRVFNRGEFRDNISNKVIQNIKKLNLKYINLDILYDFIFTTGVMNASTAIIYCLGGYFAYKNIITVGAIVSFGLYYSKLWDVINSFMDFLKSYKIKLISLNRIIEYLSLEEENIGEQYIDNINSIEVKNLNFISNDKIILKDIYFNLLKNEKVGIEGDNGSGKSTFAKLLVHLLDANSGEILFNGININYINTISLRNKIVYIPAEPYIFSGDIYSNIVCNNVEIKKIQDYINEFTLNRDIMDIKGNMIEESLSSGERKIFQIVNGLLIDADVYILDEPLNFIDEANRVKMIEFLFKECSNKMLIIISHDKEILKMCDKIFNLENGCLIRKNIIF